LPTKAGPAIVPYVPSPRDAPDAAVSSAEALRKGIGYVGYVAFWISVVSMVVLFVATLILVAAIIALFAACLGAFGGG
jgi:hypothetical protein